MNVNYCLFGKDRQNWQTLEKKVKPDKQNYKFDRAKLGETTKKLILTPGIV